MLGALLGLSGGLAFHVASQAGPVSGPLLGALAGTGFAALTTERARTTGGGLLWGLAFALLLWFASLLPLAGGTMPTMDAARMHFPQLVAALLLMGAPLGMALGAYRVRVRVSGEGDAEPFSVARALVCGGMAGLLGGSVFAWWIARSGQLLAVADLVGSREPLVGLLVHFALALTIGGSFGLLFQQDVRVYKSSMGW